MSTRAWAIVMALMLGGCAFGNESNYQNATPTLQIATTNEIALGVHDQRPNVVSGRNSLTYAGVTRSRAGIPYGVHTKSGRPLADDFSTAIANGLAEKQINVTVVTIPATDTRDQAIKALLDQGKPRALLVTIDEWETDLSVHMSVAFAMRADVFDQSGTELATHEGVAYNTVKDPTKKASFFTINTHTPADQQASDIARQVLQQLLNDPDIIKALR